MLVFPCFFILINTFFKVIAAIPGVYKTFSLSCYEPCPVLRIRNVCQPLWQREQATTTAAAAKLTQNVISLQLNASGGSSRDRRERGSELKSSGSGSCGHYAELLCKCKWMLQCSGGAGRGAECSCLCVAGGADDVSVCVWEYVHMRMCV